MKEFLFLKNASFAKLSALPEFSFEDFRILTGQALSEGCHVSAFFALPEEECFRLILVLGDAAAHKLRLASSRVGTEYPSLTPEFPQFHYFERELAEQYAVIPVGHPNLKPLRFERCRIAGRDAWNRSGEADFVPHLMDAYRVEGESIHEVAVGPVHAGVIEPGHFRFQCHGELVYTLEISLGYQHRGVERRMVGGPGKLTEHWMETLAGDTTVGHMWTYCRMMEALTGMKVPAAAEAIRAIALELERIANHVGDLGALAGDVAFLPTASYCGRIRGEYLNMTALLCGNRFGRGLLCPGGVSYDLDISLAAKLSTWIDKIFPQTLNAVDLMLKTPSALDRFEGTGTVDRDMAGKLGMVGVPARASGIVQDVRRDFPCGIYTERSLKAAKAVSGDTLGRILVRYQEIKASAHFVSELIDTLPDGPLCAERVDGLPTDSIAVSLTEGWRGEICHVCVTDAAGRFKAYKVVDPSFHNWPGLAMALRGEQISNFPICNKSFNLSYCGHDL